MALQKFKDLAFRGVTNFGVSAVRGDFALIPSAIGKFGYNADIGNTVEETIWDGGGRYTYPLSSQVMFVHSDDSGDAHDGAGARQLEFQGLNSSGELITEVVTLNGTNVVSTVAQVMRIWRGKILAAGNSETNIGNIYMSTDTVSSNGIPTNKHMQILPGNAQTLMMLFTTPISHQLFLLHFGFSSAGNNSTIMDGKIWVRPLGEVWQIKQYYKFTRDSAVNIDHSECPILFPPLADIEARAKASTGTLDVAAFMDLYSIAKDF